MADTLDRNAVERAYARWAPVYDLVFGKVFERGRRASIAAAERVGGRILEVGVGTGINLSLYPKNCNVTWIDFSESMLEIARERVQEALLRLDGLGWGGGELQALVERACQRAGMVRPRMTGDDRPPKGWR